MRTTYDGIALKKKGPPKEPLHHAAAGFLIRATASCSRSTVALAAASAVSADNASSFLTSVPSARSYASDGFDGFVLGLAKARAARKLKTDTVSFLPSAARTSGLSASFM